MTKPLPKPAPILIPLHDINILITATLLAIDRAEIPYREAQAAKKILNALLKELETTYAKPRQTPVQPNHQDSRNR